MKNPSAIGQAINLAAADARKHDKESCPGYIFERYVYWTYVCEMIQSADLDMIKEVIDKPEFVAAMDQLKESIQ